MKKATLIICLSLLCLSKAIAQQQLECGTKATGPAMVVDNTRLQQQKTLFTAPYQLMLFVHICANDDGSNLAVTNYPALLQYLEDTRAFYAAHNICFLLAGIDTVRSTFLNYCVTDDPNTEDGLSNNGLNSCINVFFHTTLANSNGATYLGNAYTIPNSYCSIRGSEVVSGNQSTLTHELGHDFGLYHTFETAYGTENVTRSGIHKNCSSAGDLLCDTEADPNSTTYNMANYINASCQYTGNKQDSHGSTYDPPIRNHMAYGRFQCRNEFTPQQDNKMEYVVTGVNSYYLTQDNYTITTSGTYVNDVLALAARNSYTIAPSSSSTTSFVISGKCKAHIVAGDRIDLKAGTQFIPNPQVGFTEVRLNTLCQ